MDDFGFLIIRNVKNEEQNLFWKESYNSIRKYYKYEKIVIIDNNSDYSYINNDDIDIYNCEFIDSEFGESRQLSAYYYFYVKRFFKIGIIIHDSVFLNGELEINPDIDVRFIWNFKTHEYDDLSCETELLKSLSNNQELLVTHLNRKWNGCFGNMSFININFLDKLVNKYNIFNMIKIVNSNRHQCALERVLSVIFHHENIFLYDDKPIVCEISDIRWGYRFNEYVTDKKNKNINNHKFIKIFAARQ
jgi:hypothetical protein